MEGGIVLNLDQKKHNLSVGGKSRITGNRGQRIRNRRKEKKKQWKDNLKLLSQKSDQKELFTCKSDVKKDTKDKRLSTNHIGSGKWKHCPSDDSHTPGEHDVNTKDRHDVNTKDGNDVNTKYRKRKSQDGPPDVKKRKTGHGRNVVISSLFRCNPEIPKVVSSHVQKKKEDVFSSESFKDLTLHPFMLKTLEDQLQLQKMTAVQKKAIPTILDGHDSLVKSQTGSGKTLAFAVPIVEKLQSLTPPIKRSNGLYAVVVVPTRELALQCFQVFLQLVKPFIRIVPGILMGGEKRKAEKARLSKGINILVCTPGRLIDHLQNTTSLTLDNVQFLVLDEADRLCEMGYEKNIAEIVMALNTRSTCRRQTVLLSATLSEGVERLAGISMDNPRHIFLSDSESSLTSCMSTEGAAQACQEYSVPQNLKQYFVITPCKLRLVTLAAFILWKCKLSAVSSKTVVFLSTQDSVAFHHKLFTEMFCKTGEMVIGKHELSVFRLHGDMQQKDRTEVFQTFSESKHGLLLCTDVAARGLDLAHVKWIVQYTAPSQEADYVHRIGRTARAGLQGHSLLFLMPSEVDYINALNKHKISLEELKMKKILTCLVPVIAELTTDQKLDTQRNKPRDLIESATYLQMKFEMIVHKQQELLSLARRGYQSFIRAYATYPSHLKSVFKLRDLHLGHVAKTFGLREAPGGMGERTGIPGGQKKTEKHHRPPVKRMKKTFSEFDSGLTGMTDKILGPKRLMKKNKKFKRQK